MRNIKFRVWDKSIKKWMFDYDILGGFSLIGEITLMGELSRISLNKLANDDYAVMQYTGLKDKNGKEIYEGDIIKEITTYPSKSGLTLKFEIGYKEASFFVGTRLKSGKLHPDYLLQYRKPNEIEVIGNIYENSKLLNSER